jgi:tetratricopeptide (TPR) repeat protein
MLWAVLLASPLVGQTQPPGCDLARATQLHRTGDFQSAVREYQVCVAAEPGRVETRSNLGAALAGLGRFEEAIAQYRVALEQAPAAIAPQLRFNLALAYYKSSQIAEAAAEFETLQAAKPDDVNLAVLLADCRLRRGEFRKAVDLLLPLETGRPDQAALDYVLGMALIRDGRVAEGQRRVDRILGRGESGEGHLLLGSTLFAAGDFPAAIREFTKAEALNPRLTSLYSYYGQALLFTGDPDGASSAFRKELAANPNDYEANFYLASILAHREAAPEARPLLERAARVRPNSAEAREALEKGFPAQGVAAGEAGLAIGTPAPAIPGLAWTGLTKPVVLVFGSYTCPKLRSSAAALKTIGEKYRGTVDFRLVYIREAHGNGQWQSTINEREGVALPQAGNLKEKREHADLCLRKLDLSWQAVVDGMDGTAEKAFEAWPSRLYVVDRSGRIAFNSRLGELDFRPPELDRVLREILAKRTTDARPR